MMRQRMRQHETIGRQRIYRVKLKVRVNKFHGRLEVVGRRGDSLQLWPPHGARPRTNLAQTNTNTRDKYESGMRCVEINQQKFFANISETKVVRR